MSERGFRLSSLVSGFYLLVMDGLSLLPDELLLRILSFLPTTKDVVATMVLSKRWLPLWMMVPKLVYDDGSYQDTEYGKFVRFVDRSLLLHKAPVLESFVFKVRQTCGIVDIPLWTRAADKCSVRELIIEIGTSSSAFPALFPRSLYTGGQMLVKLTLNNVILVDVSSPVSFPSLKFLQLVSVKYPGDEFVKSFLSSCLVLECLIVVQCPGDNVTIFAVRVPSLKRLFVAISKGREVNDLARFVIDAPSVEELAIYDYSGVLFVSEKKMRNIVEAEIDAHYMFVWKMMVSINSAKRLRLCLPYLEYEYPVNPYVDLENLAICTCEPDSLSKLMSILRASPNLQYLKLEQRHNSYGEPRPCWFEPNPIPRCVLSSLETLEWENYEGTYEEIEVVAFILRNGSCLKKVTISSKSTDRDKKLEMIKELSSLARSSPICHLTFY